jgi:hypothetical protein
VDGYYVQNSVYPDGTGTGTGSADTPTPGLNDPVDIAELLTATDPYLQAAPQTGENFSYADPTTNGPGTIKGSVNGTVCQTG